MTGIPAGRLVTVACALVAAGAGCDPNARASSESGILIPKERISRLYESCGRTADCAEGLRCFDNSCRATEASVVGEYHAMAGARALREDNIPRAIEAYTAAVNRYESDRVPVPASLLCAKGRALAAAADQPERGEAATLALHQCLRQAPVGSLVRREALVALAGLGRYGLDPELLARDEDVSRYLTRKPAAPALDSIQVSIQDDGRSRPSTYGEWTALIQSDEVRAQLLPCWEGHYKATKEKILVVPLEFRYRFYMDEYEESRDRDKLTISSSEPATGTPERCVYGVLEPMGDGFSKSKRSRQKWESLVTISLGQ